VITNEASGGQARRLKPLLDGAQRLASLLALLLVGVTVLMLIAAVTVPLATGYRTYVIYGSSMEPAIRVGSLVITSPADKGDIEVSDVVAFRAANGTTVTHRVVAIREDGGQRHFKTKGDASDDADPRETTFENGVRKVLFTAPYAGYFVDFARSPPGIAALIVLPAAVLLALELAGARRRDDDEPPRGTGEWG
jgi:signal peptidase